MGTTETRRKDSLKLWVTHSFAVVAPCGVCQRIGSCMHREDCHTCEVRWKDACLRSWTRLWPNASRCFARSYGEGSTLRKGALKHWLQKRRNETMTSRRQHVTLTLPRKFIRNSPRS